MDPLPSTLRNRGQVLGTRREKGGSFPHYQSEMSDPSIPSWESPSEWTKTKVKHTSGWVYLPRRLCSGCLDTESSVSKLWCGITKPQFPELAAQILECSSPSPPSSGGRGTGSSALRLPRPMWSREEMAIQWLQFTRGMNHSQHEMTSLHSGTNRSPQQSSQGVKQHLPPSGYRENCFCGSLKVLW